MKKLDIITETYDCGDNFRMDIVQEGDYVEAWIYNNCFGDKALIYGVDNCTKEECIKEIERCWEYYIDTYKENNYID